MTDRGRSAPDPRAEALRTARRSQSMVHNASPGDGLAAIAYAILDLADAIREGRKA